MIRGLAAGITEHSRLVVAVLLVATLVVGAGVPLVEQETSLDQFQTDTDEADAQDYVDTNFERENGNGSVSQVVVRGENVLSRDSLLATLDYQAAIAANETVNASLDGADATRSVATAAATTAYADDRRAELDARERELNETSRALHEALATLDADPNASVRAEYDAVAANASANLTGDYATFADAAATLRNDSASESARETAYQQGTQGVLDAEYAALQADAAALRDGVDPSLAEQRDALAALNETEVDGVLERVLGDASQRGGALSLMPTDYETGDTEANATLLVAVHATDGAGTAPSDAPQSLVDAELAMASIGDAHGDDATSYLVFGNGVVADETDASMTDSLTLVGPLALLFVVVVLVIAYRDLVDVVLGVLGVGLVLVWTFGVMGWVGIAFNQPFIIVVVLLIGLSIDYAIHVVMRYREERTDSTETTESTGDERSSPREAMTTALGSVGVALVLVTGTTVIGFLSNLASPLSVFRQIGVVSAIGIVATLVVFGALVPAVKTELDEFLASRGHAPGGAAIGAADGVVRRALQASAGIARRAPVAVIVVAVLVSAGGAYGATQVDTSFAQEDFLADDPADWLKDLPEPFAPGDYTAKAGMDVLNDRFVRQDAEGTVLVEGDVASAGTLDRLDAATENASTMAVVATYPNGDTAVRTPLTVMRETAAANESFNATFHASDTDDDGVPDENVTAVYDALYGVAPDDAATVLHRTDGGEYDALVATVSVDGAAEDAVVTDQLRWFAADVEDGVEGAAAAGAGGATDGDVTATATGSVVINAVTADQLLDTVVQGLVVALVAALVFLTAAYAFTEGTATLGAVVVLPVAFTVTWVLGSMWFLEVPFNIVTGLITSLTIGLGIDYSIHVGERFVQELDASGDVDAALEESVTGTGGALLSSAATTASGFGVLTVALLPFLQAFGVITALTIAYAFLASVFVLPSALALWARWTGRGDALADDTRSRGTTDATGSRSTTDATGSRSTTDATGSRSTAGDATASGEFPASGFVEATPTASRDRRAGAVRRVDDVVAAPDGTLTVTVTVHETADRVLLHEHAPGPITPQAVAPTPVRVVDADDECYLLWGRASQSATSGESRSTASDESQSTTSDESRSATSDESDLTDSDDRQPRRFTYNVNLPADASDGATLAFDGTVATASGEVDVDGDREVPVVADVFQRVLERGSATDRDVHAAAGQLEADALTDAEFRRLCRAWLAADADAPTPPLARPTSDD
ncbi:efflux RND transporter permease subunit [Halorubellus litoreus]|uniref:RND family transporter n=1 Tax=Halorubellus litoreus TaxID=755308 RepID=A0ABD5VF42_9EURY